MWANISVSSNGACSKQGTTEVGVTMGLCQIDNRLYQGEILPVLPPSKVLYLDLGKASADRASVCMQQTCRWRPVGTLALAA